MFMLHVIKASLYEVALKHTNRLKPGPIFIMKFTQKEGEI